jgi:hypothetical protein
METLELPANAKGNIVRLIQDFFNPAESWGRQNRNQLFTGAVCSMLYFITNIFFRGFHPGWNPFLESSNGLITAFLGSILLGFGMFIFNLSRLSFANYPWYERYMPMIITLLGIITLAAFQNLDGQGGDDASLWINIVVLLIIFIIAAGYFIEGKSNEKIIKIWFALFGYYLSVIAFFYAAETFLF